MHFQQWGQDSIVNSNHSYIAKNKTLSYSCKNQIIIETPLKAKA